MATGETFPWQLRDLSDPAKIILASNANRRNAAADALQAQIARERIASEEFLQGNALAARAQETRDKLQLEREQAAQIMAWRQAQQEQLNAYRQAQQANYRERFSESLRLRQQIEQRKAAAAAEQMQAMMEVQRLVGSGMPIHQALTEVRGFFGPGTGAPSAMVRGLSSTMPQMPRFDRSPSGRPYAQVGPQGPVQWEPNSAGTYRPQNYLSDIDKNNLSTLAGRIREIRSKTSFLPPGVKVPPALQGLLDELPGLEAQRKKIIDDARARGATRGGAPGAAGGEGWLRVQFSSGKVVPVQESRLPQAQRMDPGLKVLGPWSEEGGGGEEVEMPLGPTGTDMEGEEGEEGGEEDELIP